MECFVVHPFHVSSSLESKALMYLNTEDGYLSFRDETMKAETDMRGM